VNPAVIVALKLVAACAICLGIAALIGWAAGILP
jgi:hypothetical protein